MPLNLPWSPGSIEHQRNHEIQARPRGRWFTPGPERPLDDFEQVRSRLPAPNIDGRPELGDCYDFCVGILFGNRRQPPAGSPLPSAYLDAAFNGNIFFWDTAFITMFARLFHPHLPGIDSLDNFYARQHETGEICREIDAETGLDYGWWVNVLRDHDGEARLYSAYHRAYEHLALTTGTDVEEATERVRWVDLARHPRMSPRLTLDATNNFVAAWAELLSYRQSGDLDRLERVLPPLLAYFASVDDQLRHVSGFYATDWASMDNSPRNRYLGFGVDTASQVVLFADNLLEIAAILERAGRPTALDLDLPRRRRDEVTRLVNERMWDDQRQFYVDLDDDLTRVPVRTIAAFWTLIAGVAPPERAAALVAALRDPSAFQRPHMVPTLAADEPEYHAEGGYWRGAVWAPTNQMVVAGLDRYGHHDLAREIAENHVTALARIHTETGTVFECSSPEVIGPGDNHRRDFVGWSGMGPIGFLVSHVIGVTADAESRTITWHLPPRPERVGVDRYWAFGTLIDLEAVPTSTGWLLRAATDGAFRLRVVDSATTREFDVAGEWSQDLA